MKPKWMAILGVGLLAAQVSAQEPAVFKTPKDKVSYGLGVGVARNFKRQGIEVDVDLLVKGLRDALSGQKLLLSEDDLRATMMEFQEEMRQKQAQAAKIATEENKKAGEAFLAENQKKEKVVALPSGLQYKILKAGDGKQPTDADTVECQFRATLIDGTEFDSSQRAGKPVNFERRGAIPGWREAMKLMPVGSKWQIFVPPQLAYGERGVGAIGPNATLLFEVELLSIRGKA
jgi:FKBP-type peptidyl-prolyl cis-trans isomerase FklB